jgi:hypothetical protein
VASAVARLAATAPSAGHVGCGAGASSGDSATATTAMRVGSGAGVGCGSGAGGFGGGGVGGGGAGGVGGFAVGGCGCAPSPRRGVRPTRDSERVTSALTNAGTLSARATVKNSPPPSATRPSAARVNDGPI